MPSKYMSKLFTKYYNLKEQYDKERNKFIFKLTKDETSSKKEKRKLFKQRKLKCLNCKRNVNMVFLNTHDELKVICGDTNEPCKLNLTIEKGKHIQKDDYLYELEDMLQELKEKIISSKFDLLFNYENEDSVLEIFETTKEDITKITKQIQQINESFNETNETAEKKILFDEKKAEFYISLGEFNGLLNSYKKEGPNQQAFLRDAMDVYLEKLVILQRDMRKLKYNYYGIEIEEIKTTSDISHFYKERYNLENTQITLREEKKISNKK